jgi:hypothetical protein
VNWTPSWRFYRGGLLPEIQLSGASSDRLSTVELRVTP